jgi:hypothetical protein
MHDQANVNWTVSSIPSFEEAHLAVLMDIRYELVRLNNLFRCGNFLDIPAKIDAIRKNTAKPRKRKKKL